jgi:hypothetical protein
MDGFKDQEFPHIDIDLLTHLERVIPEMCPDLQQSDREIFHYAGRRSLVRMLRQIFNEQNEVS